MQTSGASADRYGNHRAAWTDAFSCWATVASTVRNADEAQAAGNTFERQRLHFTVRWSTETAAVDTKHYRILLGDRIYNIVSIDDMGFRHHSRRFTAELCER